MAWDIVLPAVSGSYRTRLGRLIAAAGKTGFSVGGGARLLDAELAGIDRLKRAKSGGQFGAYLAQFLLDIDTLESELLAGVRGDAWLSLIKNINISFLSGLFSLTGSSVLPIMVSAGMTALGEYEALSAERPRR